MRKRKKSKLGLVVLMVIFIYFAYTAAGQQKILFMKDADLIKVQSKIDEETEENDKLKEEQKALDSDEYVEKIAREKLGMVKTGDRVYFDIGK